MAWAYCHQPNDIEVITNWDSKLSYNADNEKAPTKLLYSGKHSEVTWGYDIAAEHEPLKWFKLLLIDEEDLSPQLRDSAQLSDARRLIEGADRDPVEVISCYLRHLWNHAITTITREIGTGLIELSRFRVVITLPAIWPHYAQSRMKKAAEGAGILDIRPCGKTTLTFISEPEAAALATMRDLGRKTDLKVGDHFVVCDAGGGTVVGGSDP